MNIVQPDFYSAFRCIGVSCEDTCCSGMAVVVDKPTFNKYQHCNDAVLGPLLRLKVLPNPQSINASTFATVTLDHGVCPFLTEAKSCAIQNTLGEDYLSRTCDTYPRSYVKVDDTLERSLYLSCPEAARMILLRPNGIHFDAPGLGQEQKYTEFPTINTGEELLADKPYKHTGLIRNFVLRLLRNRNYLVWERLVLLGMYCDQLSRLPVDELMVGTPALTTSFETSINESQFAATLAGITSNTALLLNVVISSMEDRISSEYTSPRFVECYRQFIAGTGFEAGIATQDLAARFENVKASEYDRFFEGREYIWENFLVSKAHKDLFPLGPQKAVYLSSRSIYQEFVVLAFQFIFARTLMVGLSGYYQTNFSDDNVITLIQSFSRSIEHNPAFLNKILLSFEQGQIAMLPVLASMLRS